jgi:hypothetical protein
MPSEAKRRPGSHRKLQGQWPRVPKVRSPLQALLESWDNGWKSCSGGQTAKRGKAISPSTWNIVGLVCVMVGVLLLFRYGMPYRVRRGGASFLILNDTDKADLKQEKLYDALGLLGLVLVHSVCQIVANI